MCPDSVASKPFSVVNDLLRCAVRDAVAPGIAFAVSSRGAQPTEWRVGGCDSGQDASPVTGSTYFDLASLTKPLTTTLWALRLIESGALKLEGEIGRHLEVSDKSLAHTPLWRLMNHSAGLPAHRTYYDQFGPLARDSGHHAVAQEQIRDAVRRTSLEAPPGQSECYSDLGYILLQMACEAADAPLHEVWSTLPGHHRETLHFLALPRDPPMLTYAATERCHWRGRTLRAEVHDDNAWTMGGVAGHAGLFGRARDVWWLAQAFLDLWHGRPTALGVSTALLREALSRHWIHPSGTRVLGWDTPTPGRSTSGRYFGVQSVGHLGFTGCSLWIDLQAERIMILLSNRVCPDRSNTQIRQLRPALHDAAWAYLDAINRC